MKFAFWKKKKKSLPEELPAEEEILPPLSVVVQGGTDAEILFPLLPDGSEVFGAAQSAAGAFPRLSFPDSGAPRGKFVLFSEGRWRAEEAERMLAELETRDDELLLMRAARNEKPLTEEELLEGAFSPRALAYAAKRSLYEKLPPALRAAGRGERLAALLLLSEHTAALDLYVCDAGENGAGAEEAEQWLRAFILFFDDIKAGLDEQKYRFAFRYARRRIAGTYAELAAKNKTEELRLFDEFLKSENMALRVAAKERARFIGILAKRAFRAPLWLRPVLSAIAAADRAKR